jgi:hypothetical protein
LGRGTFLLEEPVRLADDVHLRGSGRGTRLQVSEANRDGVGLLCEGLHGVAVSDLALTAGANEGAVAGVVLDDCGDCQVRDVFAVGFAHYGIWVRNNSFLCEVRGCKLGGNGRANLYLEHLERGGRGGDYAPNLVTNCIAYGGGTGFECDRAIVLNIVGCAVYQPNKYAYHVRNTSNSVLISGCRSFQVEQDAVVVEASHEINISSNTFCWHEGHGIVLKDVIWGTVCGNNVIDSGSVNLTTKTLASTTLLDVTVEVDGEPYTHPFHMSPPDDYEPPLMNGIYLIEGTRGVTVNGNAIFNWGPAPHMKYGVEEDTSCINNVISANNINFCQQGAVLSKGSGSQVHGNVSRVDEAYLGKPAGPGGVHVFDVELIRRFIQDLGASIRVGK